MLSLQIDRGELRLAPAEQAVHALLKQPHIDLYNHFAPVREEGIGRGSSDDERFPLIDEAIAALRRERSKSPE